VKDIHPNFLISLEDSDDVRMIAEEDKMEEKERNEGLMDDRDQEDR
jgi:hypothetical protein